MVAITLVVLGVLTAVFCVIIMRVLGQSLAALIIAGGLIILFISFFVVSLTFFFKDALPALLENRQKLRESTGEKREQIKQDSEVVKRFWFKFW